MPGARHGDVVDFEEPVLDAAFASPAPFGDATGRRAWYGVGDDNRVGAQSAADSPRELITEGLERGLAVVAPPVPADCLVDVVGPEQQDQGPDADDSIRTAEEGEARRSGTVTCLLKLRPRRARRTGSYHCSC